MLFFWGLGKEEEKPMKSDTHNESEEEPFLFNGMQSDPGEVQRKALLARGKDELNLAEFPLTALSNRVDPGCKTLEFKDTVWDKGAKKLVERRLTITAADKFGLPTALDDEVILALIQLSKQQGFRSKTVTFSRYEIIQMLGWRNETRSYKRIEESLDRWLGVTLKYRNAWWNPQEKAWVSEGFHIIDRITTIGKESGKGRDAFVWNDVVFESFRNGNLKSLDLNQYRSLNSAVAKRLYRLLDKRFFHRSRVEFDLVELAFDKLGVSRNYAIGNLKQKLAPAIAELEDMGFIRPAKKAERYCKISVGVWHVIFQKASKEVTLPLNGGKSEEQDTSGLEAQMIKLGVNAMKARRLMATFPEDYLQHKVEVTHYVMMQKEGGLKNPAGFLIKAIEEDYATPSEYKNPEARAAEDAANQQQKIKLVEKQNAKRRGDIEEFLKVQYDREIRRLIDEKVQSETPARRESITSNFLETIEDDVQLMSEYRMKGLKGLMVSLEWTQFLDEKWGIRKGFPPEKFRLAYEIHEQEGEKIELWHEGKRVSVPDSW
jgi:hypothetical protein